MKDVPKKFQGYRRPRRSRDPWQPVKGAEADRPGEVMQLLMDLSEKLASETDWEYQIMPAGQTPEAWPSRYSHRMMRPLSY